MNVVKTVKTTTKAMNFDLHIIIRISIDEKTGMTYLWHTNNGSLEKKKYEPSEHIIPEMYRKYILLRGSHFYAYVKKFSHDCLNTDVDEFLEKFPTWSEVQKEIKKSMNGDDINNNSETKWTRKDHDGFKIALEWMATHFGVFGVSWDY